MQVDTNRESHAGFHFYNLFQNCNRKFYLRYVLGFMPSSLGPELLEGGAFHAGKASWYRRHEYDTAVAAGLKDLKKRRKEFESDQLYEIACFRVEQMLTAWIYDVGVVEMENTRVIKVEYPIEAKLNGGLFMTMRIDAVLQPRDHDYWLIYETKTTGFSSRFTSIGVRLGDQSTSYLYGLRQEFPKQKILGVVPDITYWSRYAKDTNKIENLRGDLIQRDSEQMRQFRVGMSSVIRDCSARVSKVMKGKDPIDQFPRNTQWCNAYVRPCEYADVCRKRLELDAKVPTGFKRDPWYLERNAHEPGNAPKKADKAQASGKPAAPRSARSRNVRGSKPAQRAAVSSRR